MNAAEIAAQAPNFREPTRRPARRRRRCGEAPGRLARAPQRRATGGRGRQPASGAEGRRTVNEDWKAQSSFELALRLPAYMPEIQAELDRRDAENARLRAENEALKGTVHNQAVVLEAYRMTSDNDAAPADGAGDESEGR